MKQTDWEQDETFLARWLAGEVSAEEQKAFESTDEGKAFLAISQASRTLAPPGYDPEETLRRIKQQTSADQEAKQVRLRPVVGWSVAASVALLLGFFYFFTDGYTTVEAGYGQQELAELPDGSEVTMNAGSLIRYHESEWESSRIVQLEGEAFFKVKRGSTFQVVTEAGVVEVLGTSFNVRNRGDQLEVVCYTGKVRVSSDRVNEELLPGMSLTIASGELTDIQTDKQDTTPSWVTGVIRLENTPFQDVLGELVRTFDLELSYEPILAIDTTQFTGAFPNRNPEAALKLVLEPLKISYSFDSETRKLTIIGHNE